MLKLYMENTNQVIRNIRPHNWGGDERIRMARLQNILSVPTPNKLYDIMAAHITQVTGSSLPPNDGAPP